MVSFGMRLPSSMMLWRNWTPCRSEQCHPTSEKRGLIAIDRDKGVIVLDASRRCIRRDPAGQFVSMFDALERLNLADFSRNTILDPTHHDFSTRGLLTTLKDIGNPPAAQSDQRVLQAVG